MKKYLFVFLALLGFLNCAKTDYYIKNVDSKIRMTSFSNEEGYVLKRRFELSHTRVNMFWGLLNVYQKDLESILLPEFRNYEKEAVGNLTITEKYDFLDSLVDFILIGIVRPYTVILQGNVYEKQLELKSVVPKAELESEPKTESVPEPEPEVKKKSEPVKPKKGVKK